MPLILLSGYPSSGKTHRARQLLDFFHAKIASNSSLPSPDPRVSRLKAHHIFDQSLGISRDVYRDSRTEKDARAAEYSAVKRLLGKDDMVIVDGLNYIKGFRYQLFCEAKALGTPNCVVSPLHAALKQLALKTPEVHVGTPVSTCREINSRLLGSPETDGGYPEDIFENLVFRYEEPNGMTRWDSPLFTVLYDDDAPPLEPIWEAMVGKEGEVKVVKPNAATVLKPAAESNYLYELDKATQSILTQILEWQKDHPGEGGEITIPDVPAKKIEMPASPLSLPQLQRFRRQFIALNRQHTLSQSRIKDLFVDYLNDNFR
ncbi:hypothetical protein GP486_001543 [Trichoglossum hirsutum]|uniref:Chromatin associated protein KTI12 n=1 Tax=Trichoglossum hirsutum TaxID=265104 RepID=A0A9P8LGN4_9PEZI|nr:hypothetical protein GP486_001543 [Trichoglossum hirsutum]